MKNNVLVDKFEFGMWCEGELMHFENGRGFVVNELAVERAIEAMESGERVLFTENGRLTGTCVRIIEGNFVEEICE